MKWLLLLSGTLIVILGILMLLAPLQDLTILTTLVGAFMLASGISEIASFCVQERDRFSCWMLASGVLSAFLAAWALLGRTRAALVPYLLSLGVIASGAMRALGSPRAEEEGSALRGWMLALGVLGAGLGTLLLFRQALSAAIAACAIALMLIAYGAEDIAVFFHLKRIGERARARPRAQASGREREERK